jgi:hypothetical protein
VPKSAQFTPELFILPGNVRIPERPLSPLIELSAGIQAIEVEQSVEHKEITTDRFAAVHRVIREENDVPLGKRDVYDHRPLCDITPIEKTRC